MNGMLEKVDILACNIRINLLHIMNNSVSL